jgi:hypothetical protein
MTEALGLERPATLTEVLAVLKGRVGKTVLLRHLKTVPLWHGKPTHGRIGSKCVFTAAQYATLLDPDPVTFQNRFLFVSYKTFSYAT